MMRYQYDIEGILEGLGYEARMTTLIYLTANLIEENYPNEYEKQLSSFSDSVSARIRFLKELKENDGDE